MITNGTVRLRSDEEITQEAEQNPGGWDVTEEELEREVRRVLVLAMRGDAKPSQTSAASCAVRYMAVKAKLPVAYGEGLDE